MGLGFTALGMSCDSACTVIDVRCSTVQCSMHLHRPQMVTGNTNDFASQAVTYDPIGVLHDSVCVHSDVLADVWRHCGANEAKYSTAAGEQMRTVYGTAGSSVKVYESLGVQPVYAQDMNCRCHLQLYVHRMSV